MNKSKFLKKSLALLLAFMLVFAMIPLGAAAAEYKPTGTVKPALVDPTSGTLTGSGNTWNVDFKYSADLPALKVEYNVVDDTIQVIKADGSEAPLSANDDDGMEVELKDGKPYPFRFVIVNDSGDRSAEYTVTWTMPEPSATGKATSAKLDGKYDGKIDEAEKTITFTVPFGYGAGAGNDLEYVISYEGCKLNSISEQYSVGGNSGVVGTNMKNAVGVLVDNETQTGNNEVDYTVIIKEEAGLTSFKIGDFETEFQIATTATGTQDIGCQTGVINVYVPADLALVSGKLMLTPTFTVEPTNHTKVEIANSEDTAATDADFGTLQSGKEFDFARMLQDATGGHHDYVTNGAKLKVTNTDEVTSIREYTVIFVRDVTDTTIDSFTAFGLEGTVNGTNLDVEISPSDNIAAVTLAFVGPKDPVASTPGRNAAPKIEVVNPVDANKNGSVGKFDDFDNEGKADLTLDCSKPVYLKVTSADETKQQTYTLTVKKAAQETLVPQVLTAKLILNYGLSNETTHIGKVDQNAKTITFSDIPYSATDAQARAGVYSFSKTPLTSCDWENNVSNVTIANNKERIKVVTTGAQAQEAFYDVKFEKAAARTGKSISDFILTEATNIHEVGYNNNKTYDVKATVKANDESTLDLEVPAGTTIGLTHYADFKLDDGAVMYDVTTAIADPDNTAGKLTDSDIISSNFNAITGAQESDGVFANNKQVLIADEKLATAIAAEDASVSTFEKLKNNYPSNYTIYTMKVATRDKKNNAILDTISANGGLVKGEVNNRPNNAVDNPSEITLTVPYSYVTAGSEKKFFFDYTVSDGANLMLLNVADQTKHSVLVSGGMLTYNTTSGTLESVTSPWADWKDTFNPEFKVKEVGGKNVLCVVHATNGDIALEAASGIRAQLAVLAEDGTTKGYYTIKEVKVADPIKDDKLSTVKANSTNATVDNSAKTVKVSLPFGTNLGQVKLDIVPSSKLAAIQIKEGNVFNNFNAGKTYDLSYARQIKVTADSGDYSTYTLTATLGTMFSDVPESAWYYQYVLDAANKGLVTGYEDGTFKPMNNITRGDFALIVTRMLGVDEDDLEYVTTPFSDVNDKTYNAKAISYCAENGFISGYEDGTFKPTKNISRQEAAKVLATALSLNGTTAEKFKDDASIASWASGYVYACKAAGIIDGDNKGNFNPKKMITRAETAKLMVEALNNK